MSAEGYRAAGALTRRYFEEANKMAVRAKFTVTKVAKVKYGASGLGYEVTMQPVTSGSDEDKAFWQATPSGQLQMMVLNPAAGEQFEPGDTYYLDFTKA